MKRCARCETPNVRDGQPYYNGYHFSIGENNDFRIHKHDPLHDADLENFVCFDCLIKELLIWVMPIPKEPGGTQ